MKHRYTLILLIFATLVPSFAQIKVQSDSKVGFGTLSPRYDMDIITKGNTDDTLMIGKEYHGNKLMVRMEYAAPGSPGRSGLSAVQLLPICYPYNCVIGNSDRRWSSIYLMYNPNVASDIRLKTDISPLSDGYLDKVLQISPISYRMKDSIFGYKLTEKDRNEVHVGFSAQELEQILPDVTTNENGVYGVRYASLVPYLVQAIKEQQKIIISQKIEIDKIKEQLAITDRGISNGESTASLDQNTPNPTSGNTIIGMTIPNEVKSAKLCIYNLHGTQIQSFIIEGRGITSIEIGATTLKPGIYYYALLCDNAVIDTKQMVITD